MHSQKNKQTKKSLCCCLDPCFVQNLGTLCSSGSSHPLFKKIDWFRRKFKVGHQGWPVFLEEPIPLHKEWLHKLGLPHLEKNHAGQQQLSINSRVARRLHSSQLQPDFQHKTWGLQSGSRFKNKGFCFVFMLCLFKQCNSWTQDVVMWTVHMWSRGRCPNSWKKSSLSYSALRNNMGLCRFLELKITRCW